ncbi:MAG: hypothetical protein DRH26_02030 [Deltaproteobacteria bacterium]|nr:MAG: hypothetical protein DRH26_02030 [Deltaproteobacteria bacterium]
MSIKEDLENIELSIDQAKRDIERKNALNRLQDNPDFRELIAKGFLESHAVRQVLLKAHPGMQGEAQQNLLDQQIVSIGGFKQYLISIYSAGETAEETLTADETTREELLKEDLRNE